MKLFLKIFSLSGGYLWCGSEIKKAFFLSFTENPKGGTVEEERISP